jgi:hypothetical protein
MPGPVPTAVGVGAGVGGVALGDGEATALGLGAAAVAGAEVAAGLGLAWPRTPGRPPAAALELKPRDGLLVELVLGPVLVCDRPEALAPAGVRGLGSAPVTPVPVGTGSTGSGRLEGTRLLMHSVTPRPTSAWPCSPWQCWTACFTARATSVGLDPPTAAAATTLPLNAMVAAASPTASLEMTAIGGSARR